MKKTLSKIQNCFFKSSLALSAWFVSAFTWAALPTAVNPSNSPTAGNFLEYSQGWAGDAVDVAALVISGISFLIFALMLIGEGWKQYQAKDPEYSKLGFLFVLVGITAVASTYLLTQGTGII